MANKHDTQSGFSLIEMVIVILVIGLVAAFAFSRLWGREDAGAGERALTEAVTRISQRRDEAVRLNGNQERTSLETQVAPLVVIDFADPQTTRSLVINGTDADGDHLDDDTGEQLTYLRGNEWVYSYRSDALQLVGDWKVLSGKLRRVDMPLIGDGTGGRGVPVSTVGFDGSGRAYGYENGGWQKFPRGAEVSEDFGSSPFWAIYFVNVKEGGGRSLEVKSAVAIAVYPSGQTEKFRFDGQQWLGFRARNVGEKSKQ